jgi:HlyD family secretion protein
VGVATYKTTLQFLKEDPRILAGLTANLDILSDKKENVLYVPTRNIFSVDSRKFVKVLKDEKKNIVEQVEVKTGLKGSDGNTEIISGLQEGDKIQISQSSK